MFGSSHSFKRAKSSLKRLPKPRKALDRSNGYPLSTLGDSAQARYHVHMERVQRDFKGIWIPREIWLSKELSLMEKVLFVEIHSLDNERGCFASNQYFAEFFKMSARQIATHVTSLKSKGFVTVTIENYNERTIRVTGKYAHANPQKMRELRQRTKALTSHFRVDNRRGGMKETSWGV